MHEKWPKCVIIMQLLSRTMVFRLEVRSEFAETLYLLLESLVDVLCGGHHPSRAPDTCTQHHNAHMSDIHQ